MSNYSGQQRGSGSQSSLAQQYAQAMSGLERVGWNTNPDYLDVVHDLLYNKQGRVALELDDLQQLALDAIGRREQEGMPPNEKLHRVAHHLARSYDDIGVTLLPITDEQGRTLGASLYNSGAIGKPATLAGKGGELAFIPSAASPDLVHVLEVLDGETPGRDMATLGRAQAEQLYKQAKQSGYVQTDSDPLEDDFLGLDPARGPMLERLRHNRSPMLDLLQERLPRLGMHPDLLRTFRQRAQPAEPGGSSTYRLPTSLARIPEDVMAELVRQQGVDPAKNLIVIGTPDSANPEALAKRGIFRVVGMDDDGVSFEKLPADYIEALSLDADSLLPRRTADPVVQEALRNVMATMEDPWFTAGDPPAPRPLVEVTPPARVTQLLLPPGAPLPSAQAQSAATGRRRPGPAAGGREVARPGASAAPPPPRPETAEAPEFVQEKVVRALAPNKAKAEMNWRMARQYGLPALAGVLGLIAGGALLGGDSGSSSDSEDQRYGRG